MQSITVSDRRVRHLRAATLTVAAAIALLLVPGPQAQAAIDSSAEVDFVCRANAEREARGLSPLRVATDMRSVARDHSVRMAGQNHLHHNPSFASAVAGTWTVIAENVGRGHSVSSLHTALMNSEGHRRNILDNRFSEIGVGVEKRGSTVWVTQMFRRPSGSARGSVPSCNGSGGSTSSSGTSLGPIAVAGDWNGDGRSTPGVFRDGRWELSNSLARRSDVVVSYGRRGDLPIVGDWNGDGKDTLGIVRDGEWHLKNSLSGGGSDINFTYGRVTRGDVPIAGDWNGNGTDGIGIIRGGEWHLRNSLSGGAGQIQFVYGRVTRGDVPLIGDWNGNGKDGVGIVRKGEWHLRNSLSAGPAQHQFVYGRVLAGDRPVIGDWNNDGRAGVGIVRGREWHLRNSHSAGSAQVTFTFF